MSDLIDLTMAEMKIAENVNEEKLETLTTALVCLLQNQPNLNDLVRFFSRLEQIYNFGTFFSIETVKH